MNRYICLFLLTMISNGILAAPQNDGDCDITNIRSEFIGKGLVHGDKTTSGNQKQGDIYLKFDYVCKAWANRSNMRFGTYGLNNSHGSQLAYRTNTWGLVLQSVFPLELVNNQGSNVWLKKFDKTEVNADGYLAGTLSVHIFEVDKNSSLGSWDNSSQQFAPGSVRTVTTLNPFNILFTDGSSYRTIISNYSLNTPIYVYDHACTVRPPSTIDIGELAIKQEKRKSFTINVSCNDSVTVQSNIFTKLSNASSNVTLDGDKLHFSNNGVKVDMSVRSSVDNSAILFGVDNEYTVNDPEQSSYDVGFEGVFHALHDSKVGNFSFVIRYDVTYN